MKRDKLGFVTIDPSALYSLINDIRYDDADWLSENPPHSRYEWNIIESKLTSADDEDGGGREQRPGAGCAGSHAGAGLLLWPADHGRCDHDHAWWRGAGLHRA